MSKKLKFAIIGTGGRGINSFAKNLTNRDDTEIVAFCDPNGVRMKDAGQINRYYSQYVRNSRRFAGE